MSSVKQRIYLFFFVFAVLMIFTPIAVYSAAIELPQTGQTTSYYAGDDGDLQAGVSWNPATRFTNNGNGTVTDTLTGLMWLQNGGTVTLVGCTGGTKNWDTGYTYVNCLNSNSYAGHNEWRFPNIKELESLVNFGQSNTATWFNSGATPFINVKTSPYWTGNHYLGQPLGSHGAWLMPMPQGDPNNIDGVGYEWSWWTSGKNAAHYVWPVRCANDADNVKDGVCTGGAVQLPKTGETSCDYYSGGWGGDVDDECDDITYTGSKWEWQDAWLRMGTAWPTTGTSTDGRFSDLLNGTMEDHLTGFIWTKSANVVGAPTGTWEGALDYVAGMNAGTYENFGYTDWRLSNRLELTTLLKYFNGFARGYLRNQAGFINIRGSDSYWTSTTDPSNTSQAYIVEFTGANMIVRQTKDSAGNWSNSNSINPTYAYYLWPVRDALPYPYYLGTDLTPAGSGNVAGTGISCPPDCLEQYNDPSPGAPPDVMLTANAYLGSSFDFWSGCDEGVIAGNTCTITMDKNHGITANFKKPDVRVDPTSVAFGNVNNGLSITRSITLTNYDTIDFFVDPIAPLAGPFTKTGDTCSNTNLPARVTNDYVNVNQTQVFPGAPTTGPFNFTLSNVPVVPRSVVISYTLDNPPGGGFKVVDFDGQFYDSDPVSGVSGTINYATGDVSLTFNSNIEDANWAWIKASYTEEVSIASCTIGVEFNPTIADSFISPLDIPNLKTVAITGTGTTGSPDISVSRNVLSFLNAEIDVNSAFTVVDVFNDSQTDSLDIGQISIAGTDAGKFELGTDNCSNSTNVPDSSCSVEVRYLGQTAPGGPYTAYLVIPSAAPNDDPNENPAYVGMIASSIELLADPNMPSIPSLTFPDNAADQSPFKMEWDGAIDPDLSDTVSNTLYYSADPGFANAVVLASAGPNSAVRYAAVFANPIFLIVLFGILALGVFLKRKKITFIIVAVVFAASLLLVACSNHKDVGDGSGGAGAAGAQAGQTYYWMVAADDGNGGVTLSDIRSFRVE